MESLCTMSTYSKVRQHVFLLFVLSAKNVPKNLPAATGRENQNLSSSRACLIKYRKASKRDVRGQKSQNLGCATRSSVF